MTGRNVIAWGQSISKETTEDWKQGERDDMAISKAIFEDSRKGLELGSVLSAELILLSRVLQNILQRHTRTTSQFYVGK